MMRKAQAQAEMSPQQSEDESPVLTDEQREIIERLVVAHKDLEVPGPEDLKSLTVGTLKINPTSFDFFLGFCIKLGGSIIVYGLSEIEAFLESSEYQVLTYISVYG